MIPSGHNGFFESPFLFSCAIRVQPLWKQWKQWTQWTVFSLVCITCGHNGRCTTLWTHPPLNGVQEAGGSNPLAPTRY